MEGHGGRKLTLGEHQRDRGVRKLLQVWIGPLSDFMKMVLHLYRIELVYLLTNSILMLAIFVHLCKAYLGVIPDLVSSATTTC